MSYNGLIVYKGISFGDTITSVLDWIPLILCKTYFNSMKYHFITTGGGGGQQNIMLYHIGGGSQNGQFCIMR